MTKLLLASLLLASVASADDGYLGRAELTAGMAGVKKDVDACGRANAKAKGIVKLAIEVAPDGTVSRVVVIATPDLPLAACVASAVRHKAAFAQSQRGASFHYPYAF